MNHNKIGIADYGMNVYYGGMLDYDTRMEQIKAMPCPVEQKAELIEAIKRIHQQRDGA